MKSIVLGTIIAMVANAEQDLFEREDRNLSRKADAERTAANMHAEIMDLLQENQENIDYLYTELADLFK